MGICSFGKFRSADFLDWNEIYSIYILPGYTGQGFGEALLGFALAELKKTECAGIYLWVFKEESFKIPLFLDTVFTMLASFYGPAAGCIAAFLCHLFGLLFDTNSNLLWMICSLTIVLVIRLFSRNGKPVSWAGIVWILILNHC